MKKDAHIIADKIKTLVDQLAALSGGQSRGRLLQQPKPTSVAKGASGALSALMEEGFFDTPKGLSSIFEKLQEIGRYYPRTTVSMNLLNLTKRRVLNRLKDKETRNWQYVLRK
jgi:hypothetical protein